ncbi:MAG TPA: DUF1559 domain-containing protein [Lacipirellulaceae bacterium]|nr:DUF1559 domain-containing protein [Lacipirellulaceae bacterium]
MIKLLAIGLVWFVTACGTQLARSAEGDAVGDYLTSDVLAVASVDVTKLRPQSVADAFASLGVASEGEIVHLRQEAAALEQALAELTSRGARRAHAFLRASDLQEQAVTWILETERPAASQEVAAWLTEQRDGAAQGSVGTLLANIPTRFAVRGPMVLGASTDARLELLASHRPAAPRTDAAAAMAALAAADAGIVVFGNAESRRVLREMFPQLPAPFAEVDGKLLADGIAWVGLTARVAPGMQSTITVEANTDNAAQALEQSAAQGLNLLKVMLLAQMAGGDVQSASLLPVLGMLKPRREARLLTVSLGDDPDELAALRLLLVPALRAEREAALQATRMNNLKQIALGVLNYESAKRTLPPAASYDAAGNPLLSWRVLILPFLGEEGASLYREFHLDEPWDSEHNLALLPKMPAIYADDPGLAAQGRTTFLAPVGTGLVFDGTAGTTFKAIIDGASNTILAVEVTPERAVEWTKPVDWQVDFSDPLAGVRRPAADRPRTSFGVVFCDGHARLLASDLDAALFKALLTIAGREPIPTDQLR